MRIFQKISSPSAGLNISKVTSSGERLSKKYCNRRQWIGLKRLVDGDAKPGMGFSVLTRTSAEES
jgi:dipeptidase